MAYKKPKENISLQKTQCITQSNLKENPFFLTKLEYHLFRAKVSKAGPEHFFFSKREQVEFCESCNLTGFRVRVSAEFFYLARQPGRNPSLCCVMTLIFLTPNPFTNRTVSKPIFIRQEMW